MIEWLWGITLTLLGVLMAGTWPLLKYLDRQEAKRSLAACRARTKGDGHGKV